MPTTRPPLPRGTPTALSQRTELIQLVRLLARQSAREAVRDTLQQEPFRAQDHDTPAKD